MTNTQQQFLALLQMALRPNGAVPECVKAKTIDWQGIFEESKRQSVIGISFLGVEKYLEKYPERRDEIGRPLFTKWFGVLEKIRGINAITDNAYQKVDHLFSKDHYHCVLLKGQAVAKYYPDPTVRVPGDIDIWPIKKELIQQHERIEKGDSSLLADNCRSLVKFVQHYKTNSYVQLHHVDFLPCDDVNVEVHFTPNVVFNYWKDRKVQRFFTQIIPRCTNALPVDVDVAFQLMHVRRHLISEGVGMRHVIDLFWTLKAFNKNSDSAKKQELILTIKNLGLYSFAQAMMWVEKESLGLEEDFFVAEPDARLGNFVLQQILNGGNFGRNDMSFQTPNGSKLNNFWCYTKQALRCFRYFPVESIWNPLYRIRVWWWRKKNGYDKF